MFKATALLGHQGLPFRGHNEQEDSANKGNFLEFVDVLATDEGVKSRKYGHYSSPESQNDMIRVIGDRIKKKT